MTQVHSKMIHPFEVFHPLLQSWAFPASASVVYHVGPDLSTPRQPLNTFQQRKHQHVDSEEVCGPFMQSLDHASVTMMCASCLRPASSTPGIPVSRPLSPRYYYSVLICASGVRKWNTKQYQFSKRNKLRRICAVICVLIWRGSICFHSKSRIHPTTATFQPHHMHEIAGSSPPVRFSKSKLITLTCCSSIRTARSAGCA